MLHDLLGLRAPVGLRSMKTMRSAMLAMLATLAMAACPKLPPGEDTGDDSGTASTGDTGGPSEIPAVCGRWVGCTAEIDPSTADMMAARYGEEGTCWKLDEADRAGCVATCDVRLREYGDAFPDITSCRYDDVLGDVEFVFGEAVFDPNDPLAEPVFRELVDGDTLQIVRGGQGLLMLPLGVRGSGFEVPVDPNDWENPRMPRIDLWMDIEGFNLGFGGHFARVPNYTIGFVPVDEMGTLEHLYIAVLVPDAIDDASALTGQPGLIRAELRTYMQPTVARQLSFVVAPEIQGE